MSLSYLLLTISILLLWLPLNNRQSLFRYSWLVSLLLALFAGLYEGVVTLIAFVWVGLLGMACYGVRYATGSLRWLAGASLILLSLALGMHLLPGFHNRLVVDGVQLAADSLPYSLWLNFDKALVGLFIVAIITPRIIGYSQLWLMLRQLLPIAVLTVGLVIIASLLTGYIRPDIKVPDFLWYWLWANLFFVCLAEEALFRGFIQDHVAELLSKYSWGYWVAILISAILFGLAHIGGGLTYVLLATLAGLGYGWAKYQTGRIEAAILLHLLLNTVHLLFFSYPALTPTA